VLLHGNGVTFGECRPDCRAGCRLHSRHHRLGVPALKETDASLGVAYAMGARGDGATALPSGMAMAATWDPELLRAGGAMIGAEARAKGFNVMLAGGVNLMREPRNGRGFEYLGEDPWLAGTLAGAAVAGIQAQRVISTVKHFALNDQETGRMFLDVRIGDAAARESDLLAFQVAIERGQPGAVMCAYNRINGAYGCGNDYLLNQVLKRDWGFKGWVMSDWGAVHGVDDAPGPDQQSGEQSRAVSGPAYARRRVSDMNRRICVLYAAGLDAAPRSIRTSISRRTARWPSAWRAPVSCCCATSAARCRLRRTSSASPSSAATRTVACSRVPDRARCTARAGRRWCVRTAGQDHSPR
jgi:hypothetical protein